MSSFSALTKQLSDLYKMNILKKYKEILPSFPHTLGLWALATVSAPLLRRKWKCRFKFYSLGTCLPLQRRWDYSQHLLPPSHSIENAVPLQAEPLHWDDLSSDEPWLNSDGQQRTQQGWGETWRGSASSKTSCPSLASEVAHHLQVEGPSHLQFGIFEKISPWNWQSLS